MPKQENTNTQEVYPLKKSYLKKLTHKELAELFTTISNQFTARLKDCKEIDDLKTLKDYLHLITAEIKERDNPPSKNS